MHQRPWTLAIDFGTSYTVAVALVDGREPEVLEVDGQRRIPSVVMVDGTRYVAGKLAEELAPANPDRVLRAPKRRLGDDAPVMLGGRPHDIVDLVAAVLAHVREDAVRRFGGEPSSVRLTYPATWAPSLQRRLLDAAERAGLAAAELVPEPVAAAMSYASEVGVRAGSHVAVYDLGGGTFDTAVVTPSGEGFQIVGRPGGDPAIGGELFDEMLTDLVGSRLDPATWATLCTAEDPTWRRLHHNLVSEVRRGKEMLSSYPVADMLAPVPGALVPVRVSRDEYEELIEPYIHQTVDVLQHCVRDAGIDPATLGGIYLVGGASRTPLVAQMLEARFPGVPVSRRGDPKTATAAGAAFVAHPDGRPATHAGSHDPPPAPTPAPRRRARWIAAGTAIAAAAVAVGALAFAGTGGDDEAAPATTESTVSASESQPAVTTRAPGGTLPPLLPAEEVTGLTARIGSFFTAATAGGAEASWNMLSPAYQATFGSFEAFAARFEGISEVRAPIVDGCTAAEAPASCLFMANWHSEAGGIARTTVRVDLTTSGEQTLIDAVDVTFLNCVRRNRDGDGCGADGAVGVPPTAP